MATVDAYTRTHIVTESAEHVIPNFLGGPVVCHGLLDKATNDNFGHSIDAALFDALQPFIVILDGRSNRQGGKPPSSLKSVRGSDGQLYDVGAGGAVHMRPSVAIEDLGTGARIRGTGPNERVIRDAVTKWAKRTGRNPDEIAKQAAGMMSVLTTPTPELHFDLKLFDTECYRAIAKIACNLLGYHSPGLFLCAEFDEIRRWVLLGGNAAEGPPVRSVPLNGDNAGFGSLDHWVRVTGTPGGRVEGLVVLLGTFAFSVNLGLTPQGASFARSLRVDQLARKHRLDHECDLRFPIEPFEVAAQRTFEAFRDLVAVQTTSVVEKVMRTQNDAWVRQTVQKCFEDLGVKPGETLKDNDQRREFARSVAENITAGLMPRIERAAQRRASASRPDSDDDPGSESA